VSIVRSLAACLVALLVAACTSGGGGVPTPSYPGQPVDGCTHGTGRAGQDAALIPSKPTTLTICSAATTVPGHAGPAHTHDSFTAGQFDDLLTVLRSGHLQAPKITSCDGGGEARTYTLVYGYATGPDLSIDVGPDCHPSITNGSVATDNTHDVMVAIDQMIGVRCSALIC
jgi:hypothetical protein